MKKAGRPPAGPPPRARTGPAWPSWTGPAWPNQGGPACPISPVRHDAAGVDQLGRTTGGPDTPSCDNWLFAGSVRGGKTAATIYTLVECCKLAGADPLSYLADVLVRVATHPASRVEELLPGNWKRLFGAQVVSAPILG